ncbi:succinylglutamate desuccinylase/aspartoacylase family protein [Falsiroseomonas sp. HW251]|uniref:succinylglutamate desuccinylase/aspartoacylase family protein n=1 Tax=Falsiroseomonas sp. HW251 TaxID=3390998 RepID=UPI003D3229C4
MKPIEVGTVRADAAGRYEGRLTTGWMPDGAPVDIPVVVLRGPADGPVLWLHGCVHGNEYCGTYIIHEFLRSLDPATLKGSVVALPMLNLSGFRLLRRVSPFEGFNNGDLNRCFPGRAEGGTTEQIAAAIYAPLKAHATHLVDFHTAFTADTRWALYADHGGEVSRVGQVMARAFGYAHTLPTPPGTLNGSAMMTAGADGIPAFIVEAGGIGGTFSMEIVKEAAERLRNVARAIGLLDGAVADHGPLTLFSNFHWATAPRGGIFAPTVKCGQRVEKGDVVGLYRTLHGDPDGEARAPASGIVLACHPGPIIPQGDVLVHIGLDPRQA